MSLSAYIAYLNQLFQHADSVDSVKNWLDKFWSNQDMLFDYYVDRNQ